MISNDSTEATELQPATDLIPPDGADWDEENLEWFVRFDGEKAGWGYEGQQAAWDAYNEMLRVEGDHERRAIPAYIGDDLAFVVYPDTCPDCKREYQRCSCPPIPFNDETWPIPEPITEVGYYNVDF